MKTWWICILIVVLYHHSVIAQTQLNNRKRKMIEFLVKKGELDTSNGNSSYIYRNSIYEQIAYKGTNNQNVCIFGTLSTHSDRYVLLEQKNRMRFLESKNLLADMDEILSFLKKQDLNKNRLLQILTKIKEAYQYNVDLEHKLITQ